MSRAELDIALAVAEHGSSSVAANNGVGFHRGLLCAQVLPGAINANISASFVLT